MYWFSTAHHSIRRQRERLDWSDPATPEIFEDFVSRIGAIAYESRTTKVPPPGRVARAARFAGALVFPRLAMLARAVRKPPLFSPGDALTVARASEEPGDGYVLYRHTTPIDRGPDRDDLIRKHDLFAVIQEEQDADEAE